MIDEKTKINILAVDDRSQNLLVLEQYLKGPEVAIFKAESGNEALGLVLENQFALILMDVQMPDMDGFETAELIRENSESREIPIIFLTAINKEEKHIFKGYQSGAVDYMFKPFDPDILKSKVDVFVELYKQRLELADMNTELEKRVEQRTEELRKAKEQAEDANVAKSRFLSNMSHELLTPLHHILSFAGFGIALSKQEENQKLHKHFTRITEGGERLQSLLQDLLDLSQFQSGTVSYSTREICLKNIISTLIDRCSASIQVKLLAVNFEEPGVRTEIHGDGEKVSKLFLHLLSNAIQYSNRKGTIDIAFSDQHLVVKAETVPALQVSITNQGIGVPDDELTQIFEAFSESSVTESKAGGKGLGLAICCEIVKAHQGKIWAENIENGVVFKVLLPFQQQNMKQDL